MLVIVLYSSDFQIKVTSKEVSSQKTLSGHEAPVLSVVFSPDHQYLVIMSFYWFVVIRETVLFLLSSPFNKPSWNNPYPSPCLSFSARIINI